MSMSGGRLGQQGPIVCVSFSEVPNIIRAIKGDIALTFNNGLRILCLYVYNSFSPN